MALMMDQNSFDLDTEGWFEIESEEDRVLVSHTPEIFDSCDEISKFYPFIVDGCVLSEPLFGAFTNKQNIHHWVVLLLTGS